MCDKRQDETDCGTGQDFHVHTALPCRLTEKEDGHRRATGKARENIRRYKHKKTFQNRHFNRHHLPYRRRYFLTDFQITTLPPCNNRLPL